MADDIAGCRVEERVQRGKLSWIMAKYGQKLCLLLALIFTIIAVLSNRTPVTQKTKNQLRFFSVSSPVIDFYNGNLESLIEKLEESELSAVMFYAPWSAESLHVRWEFDRAARFFNNQLMFMAINCWWADGTCRQKQKITAFPLIYIYSSSLTGIQYRGVLAAEYLISFIDKFIDPLTSLFSEDDISTFLYKQDIGILGFFDFHSSPLPPGYNIYYQAALKALEKDPRQQIKFGVITNKKVALICNFTESSTVKLFELHNTSMRNYPKNAVFNVENLLNWIFTHNRQVVPILNPPGGKSLLFSNVIAQKPVAILLAPDNPLFNRFPGLSVFREVALDYFNCKNSKSLKWAIHQNWMERQQSIQHDKELEDHCSRLRSKTLKAPVTYTNRCCQSVVIQHSVNLSEESVCDVCVCQRKQLQSYCVLDIHDYLVFHKMSNSLHGCESITHSSYNPHKEVTLCCRQNKTHKPTLDIHIGCNSNVKEPAFNHDQYLEDHQNYKCKLYRFGKQRQFLVSKASTTSFPWNTVDNFAGLGCRTNKTLKFFTLDTWQYYAFAERLGLRSKGIHRSRGGLVILDRLRETQYVLNKELTHFNIAEFLWNYTYGHLDRFLRSSSESKSLPPVLCDNLQTLTRVCLTEITSATFDEVVLDEKKDVVLLYFTPWCGFCAGITHIYLSVARYFKMASKLLFARINADANDLPWEFTVENYPTIIFFPAQRKADSISFPSHLPITFQNLVQFILIHAQKQLKLQTALSICSRTCIENNRKLALTQIRNLHNEIISLKLQIHRLQSRLDNMRLAPANNHQATFWATTLQNYIVDLRREVRRKTYQSHNAKLLYKTLDETKGLFIDGSKLSTVIKAYHNYHHVMRNNTIINNNDIFNEKSHEWLKIESPSTLKDEL